MRLFAYMAVVLGLTGCDGGRFSGGWAFLGIMAGGFVLLLLLVVRYFAVASKARRTVKPPTEVLDPWGDYPSRAQEYQGQQPHQEADGGHPEGQQPPAARGSDRPEG